jgi:hypothetical protein
MRILLLFRNTRDAISAERIIRGEEIDCRVVPAPRYISADCGMALEIEEESKEKVLASLEKHDITAKTAKPEKEAEKK